MKRIYSHAELIERLEIAQVKNIKLQQENTELKKSNMYLSRQLHEIYPHIDELIKQRNDLYAIVSRGT